MPIVESVPNPRTGSVRSRVGEGEQKTQMVSNSWLRPESNGLSRKGSFKIPYALQDDEINILY
jgi:hypothetical protein